VVDGIGVYLPLWTAETSIISFSAHIPLLRSPLWQAKTNTLDLARVVRRRPARDQVEAAADRLTAVSVLAGLERILFKSVSGINNVRTNIKPVF
jgi:hypothetical protein